MNILTAIPLIKSCIDANEPVMLWGPTGVGKSDLVRQLTREYSTPKAPWYCIDRFRASTLDTVDVRGVPTVEKGRTVFNPSDDLPDEKRDGKNGFAFFDEINTGPMAVQAMLFGLVLDRRTGNYTLPAGCRIIAAGNRISDRAAALKMASALADRFFHFDIDPDFASFKVWAELNGILPEIIAFLAWCESKNNSLLHKMPTTGEARAFPTPRGWEKVSRVLQKNASNAYHIAAAKVGEAAAAEFKGFLDYYRDLPKLAEIIATPDSCRVPLEPAAQYAVTGMLSRAADAKTLKPIVTYMRRLSTPEFSVSCITDAVRRDATLKQAPGFTDWAVANQHVSL